MSKELSRALAGTGFSTEKLYGPEQVEFRQSALFLERRRRIVTSPEGRKITGQFSQRWEKWSDMAERSLILEEEEKITNFLKENLPDYTRG